MKCKCGRPRQIIYCPRCGKQTRLAHACAKCMESNRNRAKPGPHQKRGYCAVCHMEHVREWDVEYKRKERGGKPWRKLGDKGKPPKWYLAKHPEWHPKTRDEKLAYKRDYMRKRRVATET